MLAGRSLLTLLARLTGRSGLPLLALLIRVALLTSLTRPTLLAGGALRARLTLLTLLAWLALLTWRSLLAGAAELTCLSRTGRALALRRARTTQRPRRAALRTALPLATGRERRRRVAGGPSRGLRLVAVARVRGLDRPVEEPPAVARVHGDVDIRRFTRTWNRRSGRVADVGLVT
ncbi:hypothetical protein [Actinokineospora terrae]|uniref:Uncharacterized protein n=1 Tax=Actinokineospora terrae TaxID=155974 RepID=A0A1H9U9Q0_9PSEU|nr:hypothetical protein [Actinokineospora terrae]SES05887.1 hypothetical protein SAMN04487818_10768 [Actinokineospora terrae]